MKKVLFTLIIALYACSAFSQTLRFRGFNDGNDTIVPQNKVNYSLETGSMFYGGAMKGSTFYVAPSFTYAFSKKFSMQGGVMFMNNNYSYTANQVFGQPDTRLFSQPSKYETVVYAKGNYQVNNRLTFTGTVVKNFSDNSGMQNQSWNNNFQMMSMGMNYKLSDNITLGAGLRVMQGSGYYNPYQFGNSSPFYPSMFNNDTF